MARDGFAGWPEARELGAVPYGRFKLGLSFAVVRDELAEESRRAYERGEYRWVTRATVLGRMHEYKRAAYESYLEELRALDGLPF